MELVQLYTEKNYCTRAEVLQEFDQGVGDVIWNEIVKYRKQFTYCITCFPMPYELILCPHVLWRMMKVEQSLLEVSGLHSEKTTMPTELASGVWQALTLQQGHRMHDEHWLHMACTRLSLQNSASIIELLQLDTFFTLRFFLCAFLDKQERISAAALLFLKEQRMSFVDIVVDEELFVGMDPYERDITYAFLAFLKQLELKISQRMVLLKGNKKSDEQTLGITTLKECYPQFSEELLAFYVTHRSVQHYYTIQQYIHCCHVCYETARYSLDQLVDAGWYQKQKMGKKFVYYV